MKLFSTGKNSGATVRNAVLLNLLAAPGLGSLVARRWLEGLGQLLLSLVGFVLMVIWFVREMTLYYSQMFSEAPVRPIGFAMLWIGTVFFLLAWTWSLVTCISLARESSQAKADSLKAFGTGLVKLDDTKVQVALAALPAWRRAGETISRTFQFADFVTAMKFVNAVADLAERVQHHPDIDIRWNHVTLALSTHDAGGLTDKDFSLAQRCDALAQC